MTIAFLMLKHNEPYRYAKPELMRSKFRRLHYFATGERLTRQHSQRRRNLNDVYRAMGLPQATRLQDMTSGERGMLEKKKLTDWVDQIHGASPTNPATPSTE